MGATPVPKAKKEIVAISVNLEVVTPDKLRKILFGFTKGTKDGLVTWTINFELHDRENKTAQFGKVIDLDVEVQAKNFALAEETITKGFNRAQVEHAITRSAPAAERLSEGKTTEKLAKRAVEGVLPARTLK
jgi:hypothetical protein